MRKLVIIAAIALAGCSNPGPSISSAASGNRDKPVANDARKPVPQFQLANLDGGFLKTSDLKGKVTLLDFWATWCEPCKEEIPKYNALQEKYAGKDFSILGVTVDSGSAEEIKPKVKELQIKYSVVVGNDQVVQDFGGVIGYPTTFLISKDGKIQRKFIGTPPGKQEQLEKIIDSLLSQ